MRRKAETTAGSPPRLTPVQLAMISHTDTRIAARGPQTEWHDDVAALAPEWEELAERIGAAPFLWPGWVAAWLRAWGGRPRIVALREDGELKAVLPLIRSFGLLANPANSHTPLAAAVAEDPSYIHQIARAAVAARAPRTDLRSLDTRDPLLAEMRAAALAHGHTTIERVTDREPYVDLSGSFEGYEAGLPRKHRKELGRMGRRLEDEGSVSVEFADGRERLPELLEEGFKIEGSGWKTERGTAIALVPEALRFYTEIAQWAASRGWLRLAFLRLDGRPLAFDFCLEASGSFYALKGGYDIEYRRFGPGSLLTLESLRRAYEGGLESYEFLGTDDPYKLQWTSTVRERVRLQVFARSIAGRGQDAAWRFGRPLVKDVMDRLER
jgi:CelD/BcsL family acetyltransferase involved in cellulose biosynthesis